MKTKISTKKINNMLLAVDLLIKEGVLGEHCANITLAKICNMNPHIKIKIKEFNE